MVLSEKIVPKLRFEKITIAQKIMNRESTKENLLYYLNDTSVSVIALKGLWGTGKSYLWHEIKDEFHAIGGNDHLYASCFGLESLEQIKSALFQNFLGRAEKTVDAVQKYSGFAISVIEKITAQLVPAGKGAATIIGNFGSLMQSGLIDKLLRSRLIVLDDIERRGESLGIDTLLGFIDLLKRNECKVLIIMNEESLTNALSSDWRTLKDKCLDREITLLISAVEAAEIGLSNDIVYRDVVIETLLRLSVTNIRVIQRVDRVVKEIFKDITDPHGTIEHSLLPATVLLTALNFNAVPKGPDIDSLMKEWAAWCVKPNYFEEKNEDMSDAVAFAIDMKLTRDGEFLELVVQHLLTGHRLEDQFKILFQKRNQRDADYKAENAAIQYIEDTYMDPWMLDEDFIAKAVDNKNAWCKLSADRVNAIVTDLEARGAGELAHEIAEQWATRWIESPKLWRSHRIPLDNFHPIIRDALIEGNRKLSSDTTLLSAVLQVATGGWSPSDVDVINQAEIKDVYDTICELKKENFNAFINFYRREIKNPTADSTEDAVFSAAVHSFLEAARQIMTENMRPRLTELLRLYLGDALAAPSALIEQASDTNLKDIS